MKSLKELLEKHKIINRADLARLMWPDTKSPNVRMSMKVSERESGNGKQRFTESDEVKAAKALEDLHKDVGDFISNVKARK